MEIKINKYLFIKALILNLCLIGAISKVSAQEPFKIYGKFIVQSGAVSDTKVTIEKNGVRVKVVENGGSKFEFPLEYDCEYVFSFSKDGYITKKVQVSTKVPKEKQTLEFEPFKFDVEIFKQYPGVNTVIYNQPVGKIKFNDVLNEFDYDTDYTKSIQSELNKVEAALQEKAKQEEKNKEKEKAEAALKAEQAKVETKPVVASASASKGVDLEKALGTNVKPKAIPEDKKAVKTVNKIIPPVQKQLAGLITMGAYTAAVYLNPNMKSYGWINYGDNAGRQEIGTKEEYESKFKEYMEK